MANLEEVLELKCQGYPTLSQMFVPLFYLAKLVTGCGLLRESHGLALGYSSLTEGGALTGADSWKPSPNNIPFLWKGNLGISCQVPSS